ncbi:glycosyltransferase family 2 protein [Neobacillus citreus]|uniref:Glycosyltransferase n=1 Tax=Neobacillus citreus TaxID=2833578 RepID=A0A942T300_9BACI|nr:glycosyltransferase [Neobacillus citreus]MCH6269448.1 glycosyltransferase [Neobacillus citreus]
MDFINHYIVPVFLVILVILAVYVNVLAIYYLILSFFGFGKAKRDYEIIEDQTRFLILVAAHNEEKVIGSTIENLKTIQYREDLFDIYIVNDNSTDRTGEICDELGIKSVDTSQKLFPREGVGKPAGLQYALRFLGFDKLPEKYDCLLILDADNHVEPNILKELNSQYVAKGKPEAIQAYLDSKNSVTSLSLGYAMSYYVQNRFFQLSKYRVGLPNSIGGTGFIVKLEYLMKHGGFSFRSLTEDIELELEIVKDNGRVLWNHFTRVFDEKPDELKMSIKQRTRWSQGHWFVAFTNFKPMMKKLLTEKGKLRILDQLFYLFGMAKAVQLSIVLLGVVVSFIYSILAQKYMAIPALGGRLIPLLFGSSILSLITFSYQFLGMMYYAIKADTNHKFRFFYMTYSLFYYAYTFFYAQILGLIKWKQQHTWVKTEHNKTAVKHERENT